MILSGVLLTAGGVLAFAGALFALLNSRRPNAEHRLTAALCLVCSLVTVLQAFLSIPTWAASAGDHGPLAERLGLLLAFALVAQLGLRDTLGRRWPNGMRAVYALAAGCAALDAWGVFDGHILQSLVYAFGVAAVLSLIGSFARSYMGGRRELGGGILGAILLLFAIVHDALFEQELAYSGTLVPLGFLALAAGLVAKLALEHVDIRQRLDARKRELRTKTRELMHSHDELVATQAALSSKEHLAAVGELAAVVAHEVRNPLAILGNAVASLRKEALAAEDRATLLEIIDSEATRLNRIVTDLLSFSRPITLQRATVNLGELIERALNLAAKKASVNVDLQTPPKGARVWADSNLLRQAFDNLIENAMQAMESGGTLSVRIHPDNGGVVAIDIIDTGEGMDTGVRARAKDAFFTTRPSGTGLGLAIVDRIISAHGGRFEIDSSAGEGTKVTMHLPASSSEPPSSRPSFDPPEVASDGVSDYPPSPRTKGFLG